MDELNLFREFRSGAAPPREQARQRASARLARAIDFERALERAVDEQPARVGIVRWALKRPAYVALASLALVGAAAAALFLSPPWNDSPGFLARAQAALAAPTAGTVLHMKSETTVISTRPACTVTHGPDEVWVDQTPPHRYRVLAYPLLKETPVTDWRQTVCSPGPASEYGGTRRSKQSLRFVPPNTLSVVQAAFSLPDPVAELREWLSEGRAHDEGKTQLDGRTVEHIRIDPSACRTPNCPRERVDVYVDPETFYPVELDGPAVLPFYPPLRVHLVTRYLTFEYLPRTAANLALTDIQAQHPNATGP